MKAMINAKSFTIVTLLAIAFIVLIANLVSKTSATIVTDLMYPVITGLLVILSISICIKNKLIGIHGKGWILFAVMSVLWAIAENLWIVYEMIYRIDPWPSAADFFWLAGYPFYFGFLLLYLKPFRNSISKKSIILSITIAIGFVIPSTIIVFEQNSTENYFDAIVGISYPIADSIVLIPASIGISLFLRGKVNILWSLMCVGIILFIISDTMFLLFSLNDTYYTGNPIEILYLSGYVLLTYAVFEHKKIFSKDMKKVHT